MRKTIFILLGVVLSTFSTKAQIGAKNMGQMNALMQKYGAKNEGMLKYEARSGFVDQQLQGFVDHFAIKDIQKILVTKVEGGATVQLMCDPADPCISHIGNKNASSYLPSTSYYFFQEEAANTFAALAFDIITKDFNKKIEVNYTMGEFNLKGAYLTDEKKIENEGKSVIKVGASQKKEKTFLKIGDDNDQEYQNPREIMEEEEGQQSSNAPNGKNKSKKATQKEGKKENFLKLNTYNDDLDESAKGDLNAFGKKLISILEIAEKHQLATIKGGSGSAIKLPKAKKNYINEYKGEDCFIAEFGTAQYYEDLQELYAQLNDELGTALPQEYEANDMAGEDIYKNSDDEVFHIEYYNVEDPSMPSVVIRIAPDGEKNTLFIRIGKR